MVTDPATATVVATCNAAGTAWESNGAPVTDVSCNIRKFLTVFHCCIFVKEFVSSFRELTCQSQ